MMSYPLQGEDDDDDEDDDENDDVAQKHHMLFFDRVHVEESMPYERNQQLASVLMAKFQ